MKRYYAALLSCAVFPRLILAVNDGRVHSVIIGLPDEGAASLEPAAGFQNEFEEAAIRSVYETLLRPKSGSLSEFEPALAAAVPSTRNGLISQDGCEYRFPIRHGVRFQDGTFLSAQDVRYSFLRTVLSKDRPGNQSLALLSALDISTSSPAPSAKEVFQAAAQAIQVAGDQIVIHLKRPYSPLLALLTRTPLVCSMAWCSKHGEWDGSERQWMYWTEGFNALGTSYLRVHANGTGPFRLSRTPSASLNRRLKALVLEKNPLYWGHLETVDEIRLQAAKNFGAAETWLKTGKADAIGIPPRRNQRLPLFCWRPPLGVPQPHACSHHFF